MLTKDWRTEVQGTPHALKGNQPLLLNAPTGWRVRSGSLALFTIQMEQGHPKGRRRYLFSVKAGELLLPSPLSERQILAVALEETELVQVSEADFLTWVTDAPDLALEHLEGWVHRLGSALSGLVSRRLPTPITTCGLLAAGEVFQPAQGTVIWVQILQGQAQLFGCEQLTLTPALGRIPLQSHLWFEAAGIVEVDLCSKRSLTQAAALLDGLVHLQTLVFQGIQYLEQQELRQEAAQFRDRKQLNRRVMVQALDQLSAVFESDPASSPAPQPTNLEEALLIAAGAVGHALGISICPSICPPAPSDQTRRLPDLLSAIAEASHVRMRRVTLRDHWWQKDGGALLSYCLEDGRPVALLPKSATAYELFDPIQNSRLPCSADRAATLATTAYSFYRPFPEHLTPLKLLQFSLRGHWSELIMILSTGVAATVLGMVTPQATAILIDSAIPDANQLLLLQIGAGLLATVFGTTLFQLVQGVAVLRLGAAADAVTQSAIWDRLLNLKAAFFLQYSSGDLNSRVMAVSQIRQKLSSTMLKSLFTSLFSFLNLGLLFFYSMPLALVAVGVALINVSVTLVCGILTLRKVRPLLEYQGKLFGTMVEIINGVPKFRVAGAESRAFAYWGKHYSQQLKLSLSTQGIEDNLAVINTLLSALTPAVLFACATVLLQQSQQQGEGLSTGSFLAFNAAFGTFIAGATSLSTTLLDVLEVLPIWQRVEPVLAAVPEVNSRQANPGRISGQVVLDHVVFRYRTDGALTLDDVSIRAEPGEFIALVGPSGSGKSTLLRLILGFDLPESGTVSFDGQDLAGLDLHAVRRQLGVVLQNSRLMVGSIFDNISSNALITMDEAWNAARLAGLADDIAAMPMQMHTMVSEGGTNLSGGQRQRLLIARALALRPRILLFDEATSALDNRTQAIVSESLERLKVTRIVVAHRLSTIRNADRIYVLQNGRVVQQGAFEELAHQPGLFEQLIKRQQV